MSRKVNKFGWWEGRYGICFDTTRFSKGALVMLYRDDGSIHPYWKLIKGVRNREALWDGTNVINYNKVKNLSTYFMDEINPTQQEIDMFNMLHGTELTREDLCQGQ